MPRQAASSIFGRSGRENTAPNRARTRSFHAFAVPSMPWDRFHRRRLTHNRSVASACREKRRMLSKATWPACASSVLMELNDCAFPLVAGVIATDDPNVAFKDVDFALLVGSRPRGPGMERSDLLNANGAIFTVQGKALSDNAKPTVKVLVVGNPANTNALICMKNAPKLNPRNVTAMMRLDHNRAMSQIAEKTGAHSTK
ncbi:hypothetical protein B566_EDAN019122, partial [Ephemera danica]